MQFSNRILGTYPYFFPPVLFDDKTVITTIDFLITTYVHIYSQTYLLIYKNFALENMRFKSKH